MGAIGILRTAYYGGSHKHPIYDKNLQPNDKQTKKEYRKGTTVINHFYEKLLLLPDLMHTEYARKEGSKRKIFMEAFLSEFFSEMKTINEIESE